MRASPAPVAGWPGAVASLADVAAIGSRAERHATPCGGGTLAWRAWGPPGGRPVMLLHGGSGCWLHWVRNLQALVAGGWRPWVPDLPGFGDSAEPPDGHDADALPVPLEQGLQALVGEAAMPVVGFSFGGLVAGLLAERFPQRVSRLLLVGAPALTDRFIPGIDIRPWHRAAPGPERLAVHRHNLLQLMLGREGPDTELALALHAAGVERDRMRRRRLMLTTALGDLLPRLQCPVGGIWGDEDVLFRTQREAVAAALARSRRFLGLTRIAAAAHWVGFEDAAAFDGALQAMLAGPGGVLR